MTPLIEKSVPELALEQSEIAAQRKFVASKQHELQFKISEANQKLKGRTLPTKEYLQLIAHRKNLLGSLNQLTQDFCELSQRASAVHAVMESRKRNDFGVPQAKALVRIRDQWHEFSMDKTNHQKAREVAFKVSQELRALLRPYFERVGE